MFVPTSGNVHRGLHRDIEPVAVVAVSNTDALRRALIEMINKGNPPASYYQPGSAPQPVVLKYAGVKTWAAFARDASSWSIKQQSGTYQIVGYRTRSDGHWEETRSKG